MSYWASFAEYLKLHQSNFKIRRSNKDHWYSFTIGRSGFDLNALVSIRQWIGVELYMRNDYSKTFFRALEAQKESIETEFGEPLDWQELVGKKASRIALYRTVPAVRGMVDRTSE